MLLSLVSLDLSSLHHLLDRYEKRHGKICLPDTFDRSFNILMFGQFFAYRSGKNSTPTASNLCPLVRLGQ